MIGNFLAVSQSGLAALVADPTSIESVIQPDSGPDRETHLDIDKSWHAIHYTLNESAWEGEGPIAAVVLGGQELGEDVGYGPARYLAPAEVVAVAAALELVTPEDFAAKFDPVALDAAEIYPQGWGNSMPEALEYVLDNYRQLCTFYKAAASRGDALLTYLN